ncbi:MAG: amidohydrolase [Ignisphaera sp.]
MVVGFVNGNIYLSLKPLKKVKAIVVDGERVLYAGDNGVAESIVKLFGGDIVDLKGRTVIPGFIDSHIHLDGVGIYLSMLDLRGVKSISELKERLKDYSKKVETVWILGFGWDQELFEEKRWPTRWDIDEVVSNRPVMLMRICMHIAVLNTRAMEITGVSNIVSPNVVRDEKGVPTGIVREEALEFARDKISESLSVEDYKRYILEAAKYIASQGVTTVGFVGCNVKALRALIELWSENRLPIRVRVYLDPGKSWEVLDLLKGIGLKKGFGDTYLKIMGVKIFVDGSLGARTAWLSKPYEDDPSTCGSPVINSRDLKSLAKKVHDIGLQLAVHGIGDKAIDTILDVYRELKDVDKYRHRIEHASLLRRDQIEEIARLRVSVAVQPHFIISDWWAKQRLGSERIKWLYPFRSLLEKNIPIGFGTDSPVEPVNPWQSIYAAVTRGKYDNIPHYKDTEDQRLSIEEALYLYTWGSAYIMHEEENLGTLDVGKLADFVVVDRDPLSVDEKELKDIKVLETYIGGKCVWNHQIFTDSN